MRSSNIKAFIEFLLAIWVMSLIWAKVDPLLNIDQLAAFFLFIPIAAVILAISYLVKDKDDDDFGGGILQPIGLESKSWKNKRKRAL